LKVWPKALRSSENPDWAAEESAVPMPLASLVHDRFVAALAQGLGEADSAAIARLSYRSAGL